MTSFSGVIFDLDGTLLDTAGDVITMMAETVRRHGLSSAGVVAEIVVGPPLREGIARACPDADPGVIDVIIRDYRERYNRSDYPRTRVFPGIPTLLDTLRKQDVPTFVATNKASLPAELVLQRFDLLRRFTATISADHFPDRNLDKADMIRTLLTQHGLSRSTTLMVGDTDLDILGGHNAGVKTLAVLYGYGRRQTLLDANPHFVTDRPNWLGFLQPYHGQGKPRYGEK